MSLPISEIVRTAPLWHLITAQRWTSDHLHVPESEITNAVAVAYVVQHYQQGELSGWDGFITNLEN